MRGRNNNLFSGNNNNQQFNSNNGGNNFNSNINNAHNIGGGGGGRTTRAADDLSRDTAELVENEEDHEFDGVYELEDLEKIRQENADIQLSHNNNNHMNSNNRNCNNNNTNNNNNNNFNRQQGEEDEDEDDEQENENLIDVSAARRRDDNNSGAKLNINSSNDNNNNNEDASSISHSASPFLSPQPRPDYYHQTCQNVHGSNLDNDNNSYLLTKNDSNNNNNNNGSTRRRHHHFMSASHNSTRQQQQEEQQHRPSWHRPKDYVMSQGGGCRRRCADFGEEFDHDGVFAIDISDESLQYGLQRLQAMQYQQQQDQQIQFQNQQLQQQQQNQNSNSNYQQQQQQPQQNTSSSSASTSSSSSSSSARVDYDGNMHFDDVPFPVPLRFFSKVAASNPNGAAKHVYLFVARGSSSHAETIEYVSKVFDVVSTLWQFTEKPQHKWCDFYEKIDNLDSTSPVVVQTLLRFGGFIKTPCRKMLVPDASTPSLVPSVAALIDSTEKIIKTALFSNNNNNNYPAGNQNGNSNINDDGSSTTLEDEWWGSVGNSTIWSTPAEKQLQQQFQQQQQQGGLISSTATLFPSSCPISPNLSSVSPSHLVMSSLQHQQQHQHNNQQMCYQQNQNQNQLQQQQQQYQYHRQLLHAPSYSTSSSSSLSPHQQHPHSSGLKGLNIWCQFADAFGWRQDRNDVPFYCDQVNAPCPPFPSTSLSALSPAAPLVQLDVVIMADAMLTSVGTEAIAVAMEANLFTAHDRYQSGLAIFMRRNKFEYPRKAAEWHSDELLPPATENHSFSAAPSLSSSSSSSYRGNRRNTNSNNNASNNNNNNNYNGDASPSSNTTTTTNSNNNHVSPLNISESSAIDGEAKVIDYHKNPKHMKLRAQAICTFCDPCGPVITACYITPPPPPSSASSSSSSSSSSSGGGNSSSSSSSSSAAPLQEPASKLRQIDYKEVQQPAFAFVSWLGSLTCPNSAAEHFLFLGIPASSSWIDHSASTSNLIRQVWQSQLASAGWEMLPVSPQPQFQGPNGGINHPHRRNGTFCNNNNNNVAVPPASTRTGSMQMMSSSSPTQSTGSDNSNNNNNNTIQLGGDGAGGRFERLKGIYQMQKHQIQQYEEQQRSNRQNKKTNDILNSNSSNTGEKSTGGNACNSTMWYVFFKSNRIKFEASTNSTRDIFHIDTRVPNNNK